MRRQVNGLGRGLAQYLVEHEHTVKFANAYLTKGERDEVNKTDRQDALAIARVTAKHVLRLPDANLDPLQWALLSTVRLHYLLAQAWPGWEEFFSEPFESKTALASWETYPLASCLRGVSVEALTEFLREQSHFAMGWTKAEMILFSEGLTLPAQPYQRERDALVCQSIRQLRTLQQQLTEVRSHLARLVAETDYHLTDIPGIDVVMVAELIALVGDVTRFPTVVHRIASTQLVVHAKTGEPRNPAAKAYYEKHLGDQVNLPRAKRDRKRMKKALLCLMRQQAIRFYKLMKKQKLAAVARRAQEGEQTA